MKKQTNPIFTSGCLIFLFLFLHSTSISAQEVEDEREFDYLQGSGKGPRHWGELKKEWAACKKGDMQSPIDMSSRRVKVIPKLGELKRSYKPCNATIKNRGHDITVQWKLGQAGSIQINGTDYFLDQCHWHSPSEHSINGRRYDLELHMIHVSQNPNRKNRLAVVGLFYKIGQPDAFLSKLTRNVMSMTDSKEEINMGVIDPTEIKMGGKKYYKYMGSLTVPPCTEGVIWTINKKVYIATPTSTLPSSFLTRNKIFDHPNCLQVRTVSREQVKLLRAAVHDYAETNARPVQPLNSREIHFYAPAIHTGDMPN